MTDVGDFPGCVDDDVEDDVTLGASGEYGEVRLRRGEVVGSGYVDVAGA